MSLGGLPRTILTGRGEVMRVLFRFLGRGVEELDLPTPDVKGLAKASGKSLEHNFCYRFSGAHLKSDEPLAEGEMIYMAPKLPVSGLRGFNGLRREVSRG